MTLAIVTISAVVILTTARRLLIYLLVNQIGYSENNLVPAVDELDKSSS